MDKDFVIPSTPCNHNLKSQVFVDGRKQISSNLQIFVDLEGAMHVDKTVRFNSEASGPLQFHTVKKPSMQQDDKSHQASDKLDGVGLASSTPVKSESKKRPKSGTDDDNRVPQLKRKKHRPRILDDSIKRKTPKGQAKAKGFQPKTPLQRSVRKPREKRSYVKNNDLSKVLDLSEDVVQDDDDVPNRYRSCRRELNFNLDKEEAEYVCTLSENDNNGCLNLDKKENRMFAKQYQRRRKKRVDNSGLNTEMPAICNTSESNATPESTIINATPGSTPQSSQETAHSSRVLCDMGMSCDCGSSHQRQGNIALKIGMIGMPSLPVTWRRKRSSGCTKRRIYASQNMKFNCSWSSSVNLLGHIYEEKHHSKVGNNRANKKKEMKRRGTKVKSSPKHAVVEMINKKFPQEWLLLHKDPNSLVDLIIAEFEALRIDENYGQLVALKPLKKHEKDSQLVVFNPLKKHEKPQVDLDEQSVRAYNMLSTEDETITNDDPYSEDKEYWDRERQVTRKRVDSLLFILRPLLGNRKFSRWKGSVIDSVVGAFLTQNVSDHLSSSVFMYVASQFPARDSNRGGSHFDSVSVCPQLLPQDVGTERCGHRSTFQVIDKCDSANGNESNVKRAPTRINLACENDSSVKSKSVPTEGKSTKKKKKNDNKDWDNLRKLYSCEKARTDENRDAVDWESVRQGSVSELAEILKKRGQHNRLAEKIMEFLNRMVQDHGKLDLEWLRDVPPLDAKAYLLSIYGLGLKSVECIRLLTLYHTAFPVDVNVARVATRIGMVPLRPLPAGLKLHSLEMYPQLESIQKYLYPRLCTLDYLILYELHYILITFGKVYCTKINPRCNACPLSGQCKHYASLSASQRLALPAPESKNKTTAKARVRITSTNRKSNKGVEPVIEMPASPEHHIEESELIDIEDLYKDPALPDLNVTPDCPKCDDDLPIIRINNKEHDNQNEVEVSIQQGNMSQALAVPAGPSETPIPNFRGRLKSVHQVLLLPDSHPILQELQVDKRDPDDPSPHLFKPWAVLEEGSVSDRVPLGKSSDSFCCSSPEVCNEIVCSSAFANNYEHSSAATVSGTLMIPVRSANNGRFPLNGTYFQTNEVFSDEESTQMPIIVPEHWLYNLPRSLLYCGSSVSATFKWLPMDQMSYAFNHGYYCNRGFDRTTRCTTNLSEQFHIKTSMQGNKNKGRILGDKEQAKQSRDV